jgi:hypothetical protein
MMTEFDTPVLFLIFNRPNTTLSVFEVIRAVRPKQLYVAADGPRADKPGETELCEKTREVISKIDWDCEVKTLFRTHNLGCKVAIKSAIDWFFEQVDEGIILEDDCLPAKSFFKFCELMLEKFRDNEKVMLISGTNYLFDKIKSKELFYFSNIIAIWGWACWKRAWNLMDLDIKEINKKLIAERYNFIPYQLYMNNMLTEVFENRVDTWDIQWSYSILRNSGIAVVPYINQISNIGDDGTHTLEEPSMFINMPRAEIDFNAKVPSSVEINFKADKVSMKNIVKGVKKAYGIKTNKDILLMKVHDSWNYRLRLLKKYFHG